MSGNMQTNKKLNDILSASSDEVAIAFIGWLAHATQRGDRMRDSNRRRYAMHLTSFYVSRLHTDLYAGTYNLYDLRGSEDVRRVLDILRATDAYRATQRTNGGNGVFQAAFEHLESFWCDLEEGGEIFAEEIEPARRIWEALHNSRAFRE